METPAGGRPDGRSDTAPTAEGRVGRLVGRLGSGHPVRFLVVGGGSAAGEFLTFQGAVLAGLLPTAANAVSFVVGLALSFTGYRLWSFAGDHVISGRAQFAGYLGLALVNLVITSTLIHLFVGAGLAPWASKLICMAMVTTWNFFLLNRVIFRRHPAGTTAEPGPAR